MKIISAFLFNILLVFNLYSQIPSKPDDCIGKFWSPKKDAHIEVFKSGIYYFGKITWATNPRKDTENPDPAMRSKDIVGSVFMFSFKFNGKDTWEGGTIYDATDGKTYKCKLWVDKDKNLKVRGYVGVSLLGRTETFWRRD
jgi:uncharacterized protein (DUF2147 family)